MNILSLDLSTHTGWAYFEEGRLVRVGKIDSKILDYKSNIKSYLDIPIQYPWNIINVANKIAEQCGDLAIKFNYPNIVIEETEGSSHRISQKTLEFIHFAVLQNLRNLMPYGTASNFPIRYLLNRDWRNISKCYVSQWPEMVKYNKLITKAKKTAKPNKAGAIVAKIDGKIVSKWNAKKLSVYIAKLEYPEFADQIVDDNVSDSILLGKAAIQLKLFG
jgi:hypothetical protein